MADVFCVVVTRNMFARIGCIDGQIPHMVNPNLANVVVKMMKQSHAVTHAKWSIVKTADLMDVYICVEVASEKPKAPLSPQKKMHGIKHTSARKTKSGIVLLDGITSRTSDHWLMVTFGVPIQ